MKLKDRVALVTGGGRGIGRAIALLFAREGAAVAVTARSADELSEVEGAITDCGARAMSVTADISQPAEPGRIVQQVKDQFGPIEILVNNAGVGSSGNLRPVAEFDDDFWNLSLAVNLTAPYLMCKAVLGDMLQRRYGRIIMTATVNSKMASFHGAAYAASKHGLLGLLRTLATEVAADGITVNAVCPGPVRTQMNDRRIEYDARRLGVSIEQQEASSTPIGRRLEPEEIAPLALYFASNEAAAVTGQAFNIDGGVLMSG